MPKEPLVEARCERIDRDHGDGASFGKYSLPIASLTLQQWTGRLIRSKQDRGLVAILDSRMAKKGYRHQLVRDMPPMTRVDREAALEYLAGI
jgi:ATP-dependent DNA helicase DinG